jgi:hypothetical protein
MANSRCIYGIPRNTNWGAFYTWCYNNLMLVLSWFAWWYGRGWAMAMGGVGHVLGMIGDSFSVPILIRTLFEPWKRIVSMPGASLEAKMQAFGDNIVSRVVGFSVRMTVLTTAGLLATSVIVLGSAWIVLWPLIPFVTFALIVKGILG